VTHTPAGPVTSFQLWTWHRDGKHYDMEHIQLHPQGDTWTTRVRWTTSWAMTTQQVEDFAVAAGFTKAAWHDPQRSGFFQSVLTATAQYTTLVRELLVGLREWGLDTTRPVLAVLDGSKALAAGVREVFDRPVIAPLPAPQDPITCGTSCPTSCGRWSRAGCAPPPSSRVGDDVGEAVLERRSEGVPVRHVAVVLESTGRAGRRRRRRQFDRVGVASVTRLIPSSQCVRRVDARHS